MKKLTSFLLCGAMVLALSGCGANPTEAPSSSEAPSTTEASSEETTTPSVPDNSGDEFVSDYKAFAVTTNSLTDGFWNEITANTVAGQNLSPDLSWEPVEGAS